MKPKALFMLTDEAVRDRVYGPRQTEQIHELVEIVGPLHTYENIKENLNLLREVEIILSGWGPGKLDHEVLDAAPHLKAVFHAAGSLRPIMTDTFWERNIVITSSYAVNAIPVAEYCLSQILFCLKLGWRSAMTIKKNGQWPERCEVPGCYGSTAGLVSLGQIGWKVLELLAAFDLDVIVYSTSLTDEQAERFRVRKVSLEELFRESDVVSLHTANIPETQGMITGEHFRMMKNDASFINTARGEVIREQEMIEVLKERTDITAVLDVTHPEPPIPNSDIITMDNIITTHHIAGSLSRECQRMGQFAVDEMRRFINGEKLQGAITKEFFTRMA